MPKSELRVNNVRVEWIPDDQFGDEGQQLYGCRAIAEVSYAIDGAGNRRLETLTSGGLYGIDVSPFDDEYKTEVEREQLSDLADHLAVFGVPDRHLDPRADFIQKWAPRA